MPEDEGIKKLEEMFRRERECEAKGHPYEQQVLVPYQGLGSTVQTSCKGCGALYDREPTAEEIKFYTNTFNLEVII